jgi:lysylphosphatidylglycerol synthetase-like protein (DUF2156 family)
VIWGALHGLALVVERATRERFRTSAMLGPVARAAAIVATFHFVCLTWIFFRAPDFAHAFAYLEGFARLASPVTLASPFVLVLVFGTLAAQFLPEDRVERLEAWLTRAPLALQGALLGLGIVAIDSFGPAGVAPFIYFQF